MKNLYLILCSFVFVGCATYSTSNSYSMLSVNKINTSSLKPSEISVKGESCHSYISISPEKMSNALAQKAIQNAIKNANERGFEGNVLINATLTQNIKSGIFINTNCFIAEGKVAKFNQ